MRPFLALVVVALVAALAYALLGGGGSAAPAPAPVASGSGPSGISVSASAANANRAAAEVTGSSKQRGGSARNPFAPLPGSTSSSSASSSSSSSKSSGGSSSSSSSSESGVSVLPTGGESGGALPTTPKETAPAKPKPSYSVDVLFGATTAGTPPQNAQLTPYTNIPFQQKLPSPQDRLVSFAGVGSEGKQAKFKLVGEVNLRGPAACLPTPAHCESIALAPGQTEELERQPPVGPPEVFDLQVVSITPNS